MPSKAPTIGQTFGTRLGELRDARGWSQRQMAQELQNVGVQIDRTAIARIEKGEGRRVSIDEAVAIAYVLGVSPMALLLPRVGSVELIPGHQETTVEDALGWFRNAWPLPQQRFDQEMNAMFWRAVPDSEITVFHQHPTIHRLWIELGSALIAAQQDDKERLRTELERVQANLDAARAVYSRNGG